uniref:DZIP3-like HEPN domain-containing protein n=1 Tax=Panagrolaimus sp. PS1159 TaxID=55785 RepID=A0AC35GTX0_9BILA
MDSEHQKRFLNHCRIYKLVTHCTKYLQSIFYSRWETYFKLKSNMVTQWKNNEESGKQLIQLCPFLHKNIKNVFQTGIVELWDITAICHAIQAVSEQVQNSGGTTDIIVDNAVADIRKIRNEISHNKKAELSDDDFEILWDEIEDIIKTFGEDVQEIKKLKENLNELGQTKTAADHGSEFIRLKEAANKLFIESKYPEAIKVYNEILQLPNLLKENQAIIYSNRSIAYLKMEDDVSLKMAKSDAEETIKLHPCWWRGYYRLGCAEMKLSQYSDAGDNLEKALTLEPKSKEILDALSDLRREYGSISREEHLRPAHQPISHESVKDEMCNKMGISKEQCNKILQASINTPFGDVMKGHQFRDGEGGVPRDYKQAAACYEKAANAGNTEGMYNLALFYEYGKGVERDYEKSLRWLLKAANGKALIMLGSGIAEAQHSLGLKYEGGIGVKQNYKIAVGWYKKAIENGFAASANNLGLMYKNGYGVDRCFKTALEYFKVAANGGDTPAMNNLAHCYFSAEGIDSFVPSKADIAEGMKWLKIAAKKGDMVAAEELEERQKLTPDEAKFAIAESFMASMYSLAPPINPLDESLYGDDVKKLALKGSQIAQTMVDIWKYLNIAKESLKKNNDSEVIMALSKAIRLKPLTVQVPEFFDHIIMKNVKSNFEDFNVFTCYAQTHDRNESLTKLIRYYLVKHGYDECLMELLIDTYIRLKDYDKAIEVADISLDVYPNHLRFLYIRAFALCMHETRTKECIEAFDKVLAIAPKDHDKVPACHYRKASYFCANNLKSNFIASVEAGLAAEKLQIPCFMPYQFPGKNILLKSYYHKICLSDLKNINTNGKRNK